FNNTGDLALGSVAGVAGLTTSSNGGTGQVSITTTGAMDVVQNVTDDGGAINLDAGAAFTLEAGTKVQSRDAVARGAVTIQANFNNANGTGDVTLGAGSQVLTRGDITLDADPDANCVGGAIVMNSTSSLAGPSNTTANSITLNAAGDITLSTLDALTTIDVT